LAAPRQPELIPTVWPRLWWRCWPRRAFPAQEAMTTLWSRLSRSAAPRKAGQILPRAVHHTFCVDSRRPSLWGATAAQGRTGADEQLQPIIVTWGQRPQLRIVEQELSLRHSAVLELLRRSSGTTAGHRSSAPRVTMRRRQPAPIIRSPPTARAVRCGSLCPTNSVTLPSPNSSNLSTCSPPRSRTAAPAACNATTPPDESAATSIDLPPTSASVHHDLHDDDLPF